MRIGLGWIGMAALCALALCAPRPARAGPFSAPPFQGLGDLPGGALFSDARGVSGDGSVVVGMSHSAAANFEAYRWTAGGGMVGGMGYLPGGLAINEARGVSGDGSVVVGWAY